MGPGIGQLWANLALTIDSDQGGKELTKEQPLAVVGRDRRV
jgi:hypothetical protein